LIRALEEYRTALETGERPDRQQFLAHHPEIAGALTGCLAALEFMHAVAPELSPFGVAHDSDKTAASGALQPATQLGDYRVLREVARGGMGIVYEAEQLSLGRRVALKVLPFAATLDAKHLQRFRNEAQAAAHLHHQNIVPVYAVGCERGVHYYAMQFIDGQTLAALIEELRQPADGEGVPSPKSKVQSLDGSVGTRSPDEDAPLTAPQRDFGLSTLDLGPGPTERSAQNPAYFRTVAQLGVQAARALEHAHQLGVVHRDIKPANLLVDVRGNLWVTDFGLAQVQGDTKLTLTGDLVGTLRYMSPEQALAKRMLVDHRTDIYSLGVTLYELLTLEHAFEGVDREELRRQIAFAEPRPPRRVNKAIPAELETIILKAIAKNPEERFATAQESAIF
jgi:serine/threonine protein kinase